MPDWKSGVQFDRFSLLQPRSRDLPPPRGGRLTGGVLCYPPRAI